jgi:hypothetical protein
MLPKKRRRREQKTILKISIRSPLQCGASDSHSGCTLPKERVIKKTTYLDVEGST